MVAAHDHVDPIERRFPEKGVIARLTKYTGWGLFAETHFSPGEPIFWLDLLELNRSKMITSAEAFGPCHERSATILPGYSVCVSIEHPFWNVNHACTGNSGFADWGRYEGTKVAFVAHRDIYQGEQITSDYSLITTPGEGTPEGDAWELPGCLCGEPGCRGLVSDFRNLPYRLQMESLLPSTPPHGRMMAHLLAHETHLVETLKSVSPAQFALYESALAQQHALAVELRKQLVER